MTIFVSRDTHDKDTVHIYTYESRLHLWSMFIGKFEEMFGPGISAGQWDNLKVEITTEVGEY